MFWWVVGVVVILAVALYFLADLVIEKVPPYHLERKHVFITGGSSGIGLAVAEQCVKNGASVTLIARNSTRLAEAASHLNTIISQRATTRTEAPRVHFISAEVQNEAAMRQAVAESEASLGPIDVAVLSAGVSRPGNFCDIDLQTHREVMDINYFGSLVSAREVLTRMAQRAASQLPAQTRSSVPSIPLGSVGRVVFVSSMAGQTGISGFSAYTPSKFALRGLAETLYMEYRPLGILVNLVNPPDVDTPMYKEEMKLKPEPTRIISEGAGLFSAETIARHILGGIVRWKFMVQSGFDGVVLGMQVAGMSPASSKLDLLLECIYLPIGRFASLFYLRYWNQICSVFAHTFHKSESRSL